MAIGGLIKVLGTVVPLVYKHRKAIYAVLTAQDRYISKSFKYGGYGKATSWGVRTGALLGSVAGSVISNVADDSPGNGIQTKINVPKTGTPHKTRYRPTNRSSYRSSRYVQPRSFGRCPSPRKYSRR